MQGHRNDAEEVNRLARLNVRERDWSNQVRRAPVEIEVTSFSECNGCIGHRCLGGPRHHCLVPLRTSAGPLPHIRLQVVNDDGIFSAWSYVGVEAAPIE